MGVPSSRARHRTAMRTLSGPDSTWPGREVPGWLGQFGTDRRDRARVESARAVGDHHGAERHRISCLRFAAVNDICRIESSPGTPRNFERPAYSLSAQWASPKSPPSRFGRPLLNGRLARAGHSITMVSSRSEICRNPIRPGTARLGLPRIPTSTEATSVQGKFAFPKTPQQGRFDRPYRPDCRTRT